MAQYLNGSMTLSLITAFAIRAVYKELIPKEKYLEKLEINNNNTG